jgi:hypothetical protein
VDQCQDTGAVVLQRGDFNYPLRERAFKQLCERIKAPGDYLLRNVPTALAIDCLRYSLKDRGNVVTTLRGVERNARTIETRAFVGPQYAVLDDPIALPILRSVLHSQGMLDRVQVTALAVGERTVIRCVTETIDMIDGRPVNVGGDFVNGELGDCSVSWCSSLYREWCTNGLRSWTPGQKTRWRHVGKSEALEGKFREALPTAFEHARRVAQLCSDAAGKRVLTRDEIQAEFARLELTKALQDDALAAAALDAGVNAENEDVRFSLWDAVNGVTATARALPHTRRLQVEEEAGRLLTRHR